LVEFLRKLEDGLNLPKVVNDIFPRIVIVSAQEGVGVANNHQTFSGSAQGNIESVLVL
jgi:hypothetical protein